MAPSFNGRRAAQDPAKPGNNNSNNNNNNNNNNGSNPPTVPTNQYDFLNPERGQDPSEAEHRRNILKNWSQRPTLGNKMCSRPPKLALSGNITKMEVRNPTPRTPRTPTTDAPATAHAGPETPVLNDEGAFNFSPMSTPRTPRGVH
mmetsp:Transcript_6345/g.9217  ORF Transcript_6345/g.9217 Transcript_6345/m.9217 type:complete len:146 (+) Transcript_6345:104-541(+)|eukprot:CAMPEP_0195507716 /NCGR_PEP_ID=MMETSP0794_2-20130614/1110_1 /TAXON_ID=515487 /ORGANISM="Stephanopyxis turris, Strain CCMP 815" /LENGTH=145 /DNA_ID=CAMNT_0040634491 /DNA_START=89 /DNA_END=526 /DNA_ORIENTATION=+